MATKEMRPNSLYKYVAPERASILETGRIRFSQPGAFNDPFEMRPVAKLLFDSSTLRTSLATELQTRFERDYQMQVPECAVEQLVTTALSLYGDPIAEAMKLGESAVSGLLTYKSIPEGLNKTIGILSMAEKADDLLMWAHYAAAHTGFVLELDTNHPYFEQRRTSADEFGWLRKVDYSKRRPILSASDGDIGIALLTTKPAAWKYESEWRMLMPLSAASEIIHATPYDICLFDFPANAIKSVILGHRIRIENAQTIIRAIKSSPLLEHVAVKAAVMHPTNFQLEVRPFESIAALDADASFASLAASQFGQMSEALSRLSQPS
jgi:Protein of unknown function (DUF2971)